MSLTPEDRLRGILPVVITGGRPLLKQRPVTRLLPDLHGITADPVWIVRDDDAVGYEEDGHEIAAYPRAWAEQYAGSHWTGLKPPEPGGFLGAFPGREYACRLAEERGCWATLQLDDNIVRLICFRNYKAGTSMAAERGGLSLYADILAAVTLSTNGWMTGVYLDSARPTRPFWVSRTGFPYSLFLERTGPGREEWFGPFEDDITHAYQYGSNATSATALIVPMLRYGKEHASSTGMRAKYNGERAVPLQRMFPETAKVGVNKTRSNGRGSSRVFHKMTSGAIRTPMIVTDRDLYRKVAAQLSDMAKEFSDAFQQDVRAKVERQIVKPR